MKLGILFVNLGSPDSPEISSVRSYLKEFLMDKYVIDIPYFIRKMIVSGFILPFRPKNSAEAYRSIWTEEGSPLIVISNRFHEAIKLKLPYPSTIAMRYGQPSISHGLESLANIGIDHLLLIPLYPHYAMSTTMTVIEKTKEIIRKNKYQFKLDILPPFYNHPLYVSALAESIKPHIDDDSFILFSYHGLPIRHLKKTDPTGNHCMKIDNCCSIPSPAHTTCYRHQVFETTRLVAEKLNLPESGYTLAFQSRLGKDTWLNPFTDKEIGALAKRGITKLKVVCPAFVSDCLETLEEIGIRGKEIFLENGGKDFHLIPCLNDQTIWINNFSAIINSYIHEHYS